MSDLFERTYSRDELRRKSGDISQIGGTKLYELQDGNEKGVRAIDFKTGSGFNFTVIPDRGMDISYAEYQGASLAYISPTGTLAPSFYESQGLGWLRGFYGGLLVTCGLTYAGAPSIDNGQELGLHGRASYIPARNLWVDGEWDGDTYVMWAQGKVREAAVFGENVCLTRKIWARLGESRLFIEDVAENLGFERTPHMILYHINIGFPLLDSSAELITASQDVRPRDENARPGLEECFCFSDPIPGYAEQVFYHEMKMDQDGHVWVALVNTSFKNGQGLGIYVKYSKSELPNFVQWKMIGEGLYVVGLEPANCGVEGRAKERERGTLQFLEPGEKRYYNLEIGVLTSRKEIEGMEKRIREIAS